MIPRKYLSISDKYSDAAKMTATEKKEDKVEDVEMKDESAEKEEKKDPDLLTVEDIREHCKLIRRSVESKESRFILRVLRALPVTRRKLNPVVLRTVLKTFYTADADKETKEFLLSWVPSAAELDASLTPSRGKASATPLFPEVDFYISLLRPHQPHRQQQGRAGRQVCQPDLRQARHSEQTDFGSDFRKMLLLLLQGPGDGRTISKC